MRLHYFYRTYGLHRDGLMDADEFQAEENYLTWADKESEFVGVWKEFRNQYRSDFRQWVDENLSNTLSN